jgi:hypothetical protein
VALTGSECAGTHCVLFRGATDFEVVFYGKRSGITSLYLYDSNYSPYFATPTGIPTQRDAAGELCWGTFCWYTVSVYI